MDDNEIDRLANKIYDFALGKAERHTPTKKITGSKEREIWQTTYMDELFELAFSDKKVPPTGYAGKMREMLPDSKKDRDKLLALMQEWNHEHEGEEVTYVLNPNYKKN